MAEDTDWKAAREWVSFSAANTGFVGLGLEQVQRVASLARSNIRAQVSQFSDGMYNVVFRVRFEDGVEWICRIHKNDIEVSPACVKAKVESTVATMRYVKQQIHSFPIPTIFAFESNPIISSIDYAYILMEAMSGTEVGQSGILDSDDESAVYDQLAVITWQLSTLCLPLIGRLYQSEDSKFYVGPFVDAQGKSHGPFSTSVEFFMYEAEKIPPRHTAWRSKSSNDEKVSIAVCELYNKAASFLSDNDLGSFPLVHGDFDTHNALFQRGPDGNLQLSAILDWDSAHTGSWLEFSFFPAFLKIRWPSLEAGKYSPRVLEKIRRRQHIFLESLKQEEWKFGERTTNRPKDLYRIFDSPAVRVAEFILLYSNPYFECDKNLFSKYLHAWRSEVDWVAEM